MVRRSHLLMVAVSFWFLAMTTYALTNRHIDLAFLGLINGIRAITVLAMMMLNGRGLQFRFDLIVSQVVLFSPILISSIFWHDRQKCHYQFRIFAPVLNHWMKYPESKLEKPQPI